MTYYMETHEQISGEVLRYLSDKLRDTESQMLIIGEPDDTRQVTDSIPGDFIHKVFPRPLDKFELAGTLAKAGDAVEFVSENHVDW